MKVVHIDLGDRSYDIKIGRDLLGTVGGDLADLCGPRKVALVTDENVEPLYAPVVNDSLKAAGFEVTPIVLPPGEDQKTLDVAKTLYDRFIEFGMDRKSVAVALGGGVIGDLAGFAAATYMRGIPFVQIPTTLLAQVDSSVGGKTAVDHTRGKNLIGAFHQPIAVFIDANVLRTLPTEEFRAGLVELIKHGFIRDEELLKFIEENADAVDALDPDIMTKAIARSVEIKAAVVEEDEKEHGLRAILNYGHTVGHAIESLTSYTKYRHGEAVAVGMMCAARMGRVLGLLTDEDVARHERILSRFDLPVRLSGEEIGLIMEQIYRDKKAVSGTLRLVLLDGIGKTVIRDDVPKETIRQAIAETS
ncbi:MAG: 3-dehydroquinate synthase [Planctomycetes bacterium]|nr:3-dehydroquinate synthase [Planctomycetota bacterium]